MDTPRWLEYRDVDAIVPADVNPKNHADGDIAASMDRFDYTEPVLMDDRTNKLVAGHGRRDHLLRLRDRGENPPEGVVVDGGRWLMPVIRGWRSADDDEAAAYGVASNRLVELGGWDQAALAPLLDRLDELPLGLDGIGWTREEVDAMLSKLTGPDAPDAWADAESLAEKTEHQCPRCGYLWSGSSAPVSVTDSRPLEDDDEE